jgi:hypothetical protein
MNKQVAIEMAIDVRERSTQKRKGRGHVKSSSSHSQPASQPATESYARTRVYWSVFAPRDDDSNGFGSTVRCALRSRHHQIHYCAKKIKKSF